MYIFIVNPIAGSGRALETFSKIKGSPLYEQIESRYFLTKYHGHGETIVKHLVKEQTNDITAIIVIGGDGTLHEVVNGIGEHDVSIALIPSGSGNDFARNFQKNRNPLRVFEAIINKKNRVSYWLGKYHIHNEKKRYFVNSIGFGFDAEIAHTANRSVYKKILNKLYLGKLSYVIALIQVLRRFKPLDIEVEINGRTHQFRECWMVTTTNHPYYGGGMKIIPHALIQKSVFPVLIIHSISKWKVLALFMTVFTGKHIIYKEVELFEATTLKVSATEQVYYQVDGETKQTRQCVITKQSKAMNVIGKQKNR